MCVYKFYIFAEVKKYGALHLENITGFGTALNNYTMVMHHMKSKFLNKNCCHSFNHCIEYTVFYFEKKNTLFALAMCWTPSTLSL